MHEQGNCMSLTSCFRPFHSIFLHRRLCQEFYQSGSSVTLRPRSHECWWCSWSHCSSLRLRLYRPVQSSHSCGFLFRPVLYCTLVRSSNDYPDPVFLRVVRVLLWGFYFPCESLCRTNFRHAGNWNKNWTIIHLYLFPVSFNLYFCIVSRSY